MTPNGEDPEPLVVALSPIAGQPQPHPQQQQPQQPPPYYPGVAVVGLAPGYPGGPPNPPYPHPQQQQPGGGGGPVPYGVYAQQQQPVNPQAAAYYDGRMAAQQQQQQMQMQAAAWAQWQAQQMQAQQMQAQQMQAQQMQAQQMQAQQQQAQMQAHAQAQALAAQQHGLHQPQQHHGEAGVIMGSAAAAVPPAYEAQNQGFAWPGGCADCRDALVPGLRFRMCDAGHCLCLSCAVRQIRAGILDSAVPQTACGVGGRCRVDMEPQAFAAVVAASQAARDAPAVRTALRGALPLSEEDYATFMGVMARSGVARARGV
jgi:hypothetical protein